MSNLPAVKVVIIGDTCTGKTSILRYMKSKTFNPNTQSTTGPNYEKLIIQQDDINCEMRLWDTAGQEKYQSFTINYFRHSDCILLVYSITDEESYKNLGYWVQLVRDNVDVEVPIILVANKIDLEPTFEDDCLDSLNCTEHIRVSACTGDQMDELKFMAAKNALGYNTAHRDAVNDQVIIETDKPKKKCC